MSNYTPEIPQSKRCPKCGQEYPATHDWFYRDKSSKTGLAGICKSCTKRRVHEWEQAHPERRRERSREYRRRHPEKDKEYYLANRERHLEQSRRWGQENKDKIREASRRYREAHPEQYRENQRRFTRRRPERRREIGREWARRNLEYRKAQKAKRRARELGAQGTHTRDDIQRLYEQADGRCWWCGKRVGDDYHVDHRIPLSKGGSNDVANLVIACPFCNMSKHDKLPHEFNGRLL